ncbi:MAG: septum formation initiator family protein [bacterium]|nr:septum formation initiator family protein [bacterium]
MREFQKKQRVKKIMYSPFVIFALLIVAFFTVKGAWNAYLKVDISSEALSRTEAKSKSLKTQESFLKDQIKLLNTDEGIEAEIREKFRAVKPGEELNVIVDETKR